MSAVAAAQPGAATGGNDGAAHVTAQGAGPAADPGPRGGAGAAATGRAGAGMGGEGGGPGVARLAVSNIAWAPAAREAAYELLQDRGIAGLEIAPGLFFAGAEDPFDPGPAEARAAVAAMERAGLKLVSMQSLLYGMQGAALFGPEPALAAFRAGMSRAIALAGRFGIPNLVFGSPAQRVIPPGMDPARARAFAAGLFRAMGDEAAAAGTHLGVEFNPPAYGTNFLTTAEEALAFVAEVDHPAVTLILDIGALHMNGHFADLPALARAAAGRISHVHMSEPHLAPAPARQEEARAAIAALLAAGYRRWISIEMKPAGGEAGEAPAPVPPALIPLAAALDRLRAAVAEATATEERR